jgi:hypothetical protein
MHILSGARRTLWAGISVSVLLLLGILIIVGSAAGAPAPPGGAATAPPIAAQSGAGLQPGQGTPTPTLPPPVETQTATATPTLPGPQPTATETPGPMLVGHVTWQGRPPQPDPLNQLPLTLTLRMGNIVSTYPSWTTDASGTFTVPVAALPGGTYQWWAKGTSWLATDGTVTLTGAPVITQEMGLQRAGDVNDSNLVDITDFGLLRATFGLSCGNPGYDGRADWTGNCVVDITDFALLRGNFGQVGPPPPAQPAALRRP